LETPTQPFDPPLLPFEKELIKALGCSEEEYKKFVRHAALRSRVRPAEYEVVPEIENDPIIVPLLISLVVGAALSAVSYLLTPKPKFPSLGKAAKEEGAMQSLQLTCLTKLALAHLTKHQHLIALLH
jgi:hypothetical protein